MDSIENTWTVQKITTNGQYRKYLPMDSTENNYQTGTTWWANEAVEQSNTIMSYLYTDLPPYMWKMTSRLYMHVCANSSKTEPACLIGIAGQTVHQQRHRKGTERHLTILLVYEYGGITQKEVR